MLTRLNYPPPLEDAIARVESLLSQEAEDSRLHVSSLAPRSIALLVLQQDPTFWQYAQDSPYFDEYCNEIDRLQHHLDEPVGATIAGTRQQLAQNLEQNTLVEPPRERILWSDRLHKLTVNPLTGFPILLVILYFGIYKFVGEFGAGTLVDAIEGFFEANINPAVNGFTETLIPWEPIQELIAKDYGIITLGIRYAVAIVLPVVSTYFLIFSILEDSGYLPRLSLMLDRLFKSIGLSGRAVIPMVLGFGCDTMATMVTRTLETKRERILTVFLLSLAIPCAAQWGVMVGILAQRPAALLAWGGIIALIFLGVGYASSRLLPGRKADFYMEVPPLRLPKVQNILMKTYVRMKWYFWEIIPLFIWASVFIWIGRLTGLFDLIIRGLEYVVAWIGLPSQAAPILLYGFFRRDYGAAGLFDLQQDGVFNGNQLLIAAVVLTLFLPCIAHLQVMLKEQGWKISTAMVAFIIPFALFAGFVVNFVLTGLGINL
jgi:ferrous iron transport protein B